MPVAKASTAGVVGRGQSKLAATNPQPRPLQGPHLTAAWELGTGAGSDTKGHSFRSSRSSTTSWVARQKELKNPSRWSPATKMAMVLSIPPCLLGTQESRKPRCKAAVSPSRRYQGRASDRLLFGYEIDYYLALDVGVARGQPKRGFWRTGERLEENTGHRESYSRKQGIPLLPQFLGCSFACPTPQSR